MRRIEIIVLLCCVTFFVGCGSTKTVPVDKTKAIYVYPYDPSEDKWVTFKLTEYFPYTLSTRLLGISIDLYYEGNKVERFGYGSIMDNDKIGGFQAYYAQKKGTYTIYLTSDTSVHTSFIVK